MKNWTATKVIVTIGPASNNKKIIKGLINSGVNLFRLNFSHGNFQSHLESIRLIRGCAKELNTPVALIQDLPGPKIRIGDLPGGPIVLKRGDKIVLTSGRPTASELFINHRNLPNEIKIGNDIFIDDGNIRLGVAGISGDKIRCIVEIGGLLQPRKGVNLPGVKMSLPALTDYDRKCVLFGIQHKFDFMAMSFVRSANDIIKLKNLINRSKGRQFVIAKIEKREAVNEIEAILEVTDGIMVARGDLGVEVPIEEVPSIQKYVIGKCNQRGRPVITATQVLDSMVKNPRPTRAEATDAANAILDGSDALMLSQETAVGAYPVESAKVLKAIIRQAQKLLVPFGAIPADHSGLPEVAESVANSVCQTAIDLDIKIIAASTRSGHTARLISRFRPSSRIIAFSAVAGTRQHLQLSWGVYPLSIEKKYAFDKLISYIKRKLLRYKMAAHNQNIIITAGSPGSTIGNTNVMVVEKL